MEDMSRSLRFTETALPFTMDPSLSVFLVDPIMEDGKTREHPHVELKLGPEDIFTTAVGLTRAQVDEHPTLFHDLLLFASGLFCILLLTFLRLRP
jgi:hypothetical protein